VERPYVHGLLNLDDTTTKRVADNPIQTGIGSVYYMLRSKRLELYLKLERTISTLYRLKSLIAIATNVGVELLFTEVSWLITSLLVS
jgi:hypothetical protein